jgi:hypothetical protein
MKNFSLTLVVIFLLFGSISCEQPKTKWTSVFNGENLDNWEIFVDYSSQNPEDSAKTISAEDLFSVVEQGGAPAIRISGEINASLATRESFKNYHLQMEFKWGDKVYTKRNSGLIYHSYGPFGPGLGAWMSGHELQLWTGNLGDSYRMGETWCEIPVTQKDSTTFVYEKDGDMMAFGKDEISKIARKVTDTEKPIGEWNTVEVYCVDDMSVHVVNGKTVMVNYKSGKYENGNIEPLTAGKIQFQSEGGELFIRSVKIKDITEIPAEVL